MFRFQNKPLMKILYVKALYTILWRIKNSIQRLGKLSFPKKRIRRFLKVLLFRLETTRFLIDKPRLDYQPLPWIGIHEAEIRGKATYSRWEQISKNLPPQKGKVALDIGSCYGFFSIKMAERGYIVFGIDFNPKHIEIARYAVPDEFRRSCHFLELKITPDNVNTLPSTNYTLLLSVWHHWVKHFGLLNATKMLKSVWGKTQEGIFFESGEGEVVVQFDLPFSPDKAREWLQEYLEQTCDGAIVEVLSEHQVGKYKNYHSTEATRSLFMIRRKQKGTTGLTE